MRNPYIAREQDSKIEQTCALMDSSLLRVTPRALMLLTRLMPVMSDGGAT